MHETLADCVSEWLTCYHNQGQECIAIVEPSYDERRHEMRADVADGGASMCVVAHPQLSVQEDTQIAYNAERFDDCCWADRDKFVVSMSVVEISCCTNNIQEFRPIGSNCKRLDEHLDRMSIMHSSSANAMFWAQPTGPWQMVRIGYCRRTGDAICP